MTRDTLIPDAFLALVERDLQLRHVPFSAAELRAFVEGICPPGPAIPPAGEQHRGAALNYARPPCGNSATLRRRGRLDQHSCLRPQHRQVRTTHSMPPMNFNCRSQECSRQFPAALAVRVLMVCSAS